MENKKTFTIVKMRGRFGTIHYRIKELMQHYDYQYESNIEFIHDSYEQAEKYLIEKYGKDNIDIKYEDIKY